MKLIRYTYPQSDTSSAFSRLFDLGGPAIGRFGSLLDDWMGTEAGLNAPAVDLYEDEHNYYARYELPGVSKDQVDLELENAVLTIRSLKETKAENEATRAEFERSISVPDGVDLGKVSAAMKDGILTVTLPKAEARKPRQISIK